MNSILTWAIAGNRAGYATRLLDLPALMSLALERRLADRFVPQLRREVFEALASAARNSVSIEGGFLRIGLARRDLRCRLPAAAAGGWRRSRRDEISVR